MLREIELLRQIAITYEGEAFQAGLTIADLREFCVGPNARTTYLGQRILGVELQRIKDRCTTRRRDALRDAKEARDKMAIIVSRIQRDNRHASRH